MNGSRAIFLLGFVVAVMITITSLANFVLNVSAPYGYMNQTEGYLDKAKNAKTFEDKMAFINEALKVYQQGPNLKNLQALASMTTADQIDLAIEKVKTALDSEWGSYLYTLDSFKVALPELSIIFLTAYGTIRYNSYAKWHSTDRAIFCSLIVLAVGILIGSFV